MNRKTFASKGDEQHERSALWRLYRSWTDLRVYRFSYRVAIQKQTRAQGVRHKRGRLFGKLRIMQPAKGTR